MEIDLDSQGFKSVANPSDSIPDCVFLSKRQTLNSNRAICVIQLEQLPQDVHAYLKNIRTKTAFKVGFFPFLWGLGLQVVFICPGAISLKDFASSFVAKIDNQWAIIQSVYLVDPEKNEFISKRTWGQILTGKYQDVILKQLKGKYREVGT